MKFTKTLLACAGILALGTGMTSCLGGGNSDMTYTQSMTGFFNVVFDSPYDEPEYFNSVGYQIQFNTTQAIADVSIDGLKLPDAQYPMLTFKNVKWSMPNYWKTINLTAVQPVSLTMAPVFDSFKMRILDRYVLGGMYAPLMQVQYSISGSTINSIPSGVICEGNTSVTEAQGSTYATDLKSEKYPTYGVQFVQNTNTNLNNESERKAVLQMANFAFTGGGAPVHTFVIKNINFDINYAGEALLSLDSEQLQQATDANSTATKAYGDYVVTNLSGRVDALNNMNLTFTLSSEEDNKSYNVSIACVTPTINQTN